VINNKNDFSIAITKKFLYELKKVESILINQITTGIIAGEIAKKKYGYLLSCKHLPQPIKVVSADVFITALKQAQKISHTKWFTFT